MTDANGQAEPQSNSVGSGATSLVSAPPLPASTPLDALAATAAEANRLAREAALLRGRLRQLRLLSLQRTLRAELRQESRVAEKDGRRGSKTRARALRGLQRECERRTRAAAKAADSWERERRKVKAAWLAAVVDHATRFRQFHRDVVRRSVRVTTKAVIKFHEDRAKSLDRAGRDEERARIQKLRDDDEEGYLELVRQTKNSRLMELLNQTDSYLKELGAIVSSERANDERRDGPEGATAAAPAGLAAAAGTSAAANDAAAGGDGESGAAGAAPAALKAPTYYEIAHAVKESVCDQPSILVGGTLKGYQMQGIQWMVSLYNNRLNGILADEMGLGKTIQTIGLVAHLMEVKGNAGPYLIIVPLSTLANWEMEFARWCPSVRVVVFTGDARVRRRLYNEVIAPGAFNVCLVTYEYVVRGKALLRRLNWQHIIIDEGHRLKNADSRLSVVLATQYVSRNRLLLTGTPLQNSLSELWALLNFLLPKVFSSCESFEAWFAAPFASMTSNAATEENAQLTEEESLLIIRRLHQVLRPFLLRRLKSDVLRMGELLPSKLEHVLLCDMSAWQRFMYRRVVTGQHMVFTDPNGRRRYGLLANPAMQLKKCVNHPYLFFDDYSATLEADGEQLVRAAGKFALLDACLTKLLAGGHRMLIFNQMTRVLDLQERLLRHRGIPFLRLDGSTRPEDRRAMVADFNSEDSAYNVFLLTTRAGGLGVNLQTADTVIIFDSDWNPQMDLQAQDRAHRIGQRRQVLVLRFITSNSVEESVIARASFKRGLEQKIISAGMFDETSKDAERQAMLKKLLRTGDASTDGGSGAGAGGAGAGAGTGGSGGGTGGNGEGDDDDDEGEEAEEQLTLPSPEDINRMLERGKGELELFAKIDAEREAKAGNVPPLMTEAEIPDFVTTPTPEMLASRGDEEEVVDVLAEGAISTDVDAAAAAGA
eukprot:contig_10904_g2593